VRDNHEGMPEVLRTYERDGMYFGVVRLHTASDSAAFEFGVEKAGYLAIKRILECRPFASMPGVRHSFYFTGNYTREKLGREPVKIGIRVEAGTNGKNFYFDCPTTLANNLRWFIEMQPLREADALRRVAG